MNVLSFEEKNFLTFSEFIIAIEDKESYLKDDKAIKFLF